jgi:lipopolysaccharide export system protein LptA
LQSPGKAFVDLDAFWRACSQAFALRWRDDDAIEICSEKGELWSQEVVFHGTVVWI